MLLTKLPLELRLEIYKQYFNSLILSYQPIVTSDSPGGWTELKSGEQWYNKNNNDEDHDNGNLGDEPNDDENASKDEVDTDNNGHDETNRRPLENTHLSILYTCRQISSEVQASNIWPQLSNFSFSTTTPFLCFFGQLPDTILPKIRHASVKAFPVPVKGMPYTSTHDITDFLPYYKGLQLDTLTVYDCYHDPGVNDGFGDSGTYFLLEQLIESKGWRKLYFHSPSSEFLAFGPTMSYSAQGVSTLNKSDRWPQPCTWEKLLQDRDGRESGASVRIYRAKGTIPSTNIDELQRTGECFSQPPLPANVSDGLQEDKALMAEVQRDKDVLVVVSRGQGSNVMQDGSGLRPQLRDIKAKYTWEQIREMGTFADAREDPCAWL